MATSEQKRVKAYEVETTRSSSKKKGGAMAEQVEEEEEVVEAGGKKDAPPASRSASSKSTWAGFGDPESKRKRRVASYKVYNVERKLKASLTHTLRWLKSKYSHMTYTW